MKKFSAKRVFAIIGIVFGSVIAFVGGVFGVMALMGKFKPAIVFPSSLEFLNNDEIVIEKVPYDKSKTWEEQFVEVDEDLKPTIEFLMLEGVNPNEEEEVNQKNCYIWFDQNVGVDLITLCDQEGRPLTKDSNNRYLVSCNEPIYYLINKVEPNQETDGKVVLRARSENNKAQVDVPLTLWIDRSIKGVYVDTTLDNNKITGSELVNSQTITTWVGIGFEFKYIVDTPLSLKPISKNDQKEIELYYVATGYSTDYVKVSSAEVDNIESPLNSIVSHEDGIFEFKADVAGEYEFIIASFPTYQSKLDYLNNNEGLTHINPNHHKAQSMVTTKVTIIVEPTDVSEVGMQGSGVVLELYSKNDHITLDGISDIDGARENNLKLYMKKGEEPNTTLDYSRFDEVSIGEFKWAADDIQPHFFSNKRTGESDDWFYDGNLVGVNITMSNVSIASNLRIIEYITKMDDPDNNQYFCVNGVAVWDETEAKIKLLKAGSYLNFYKYTSDDLFTLYDLDFEAKPVLGSKGQTKSWNIITKELPDLTNGTPLDASDDFELKLGILVVNNHGEFTTGKFFDHVPVTVSEVELNYDVIESEIDLNIGFKEGTELTFDKKTFEQIIHINSGSYNSAVFVAKKETDGNYIVNVVPSVEFSIEGISYVLVGNVDENPDTHEKTFNNVVEINANVTADKQSCDIFMLQLKNTFDETTNSVLYQILNDGTIDPNKYVRELHADNKITINSKYIMNSGLLTHTYYDVYKEPGKADVLTRKKDENYAVYEKTANHKIVINSSSTVMLQKIVDFYSLNKDSFKIKQYNENLVIVDAGINADGEFVVTYESKQCLSDENIVILITLEFDSYSENLDGIVILDGSPKQIVFNTGTTGGLEGTKIYLSQEINEVSDSVYLQIVVGYVAGEYTYKVKYIDESLGIEKTLDSTIGELFNRVTSLSTNPGFQDFEDGKGQIITVEYASSDKQIFNTDNLYKAGAPFMKNLVEKNGKTTLAVTIGTRTNYINIETDTSAFDLEFESTTVTSSKQTFTLNDIDVVDGSKRLIALTYSNPDAPTPEYLSMALSNVVYIDNVKCVDYDDGALVVSGNKNVGWTLKKNETDDTPVLSIQDAETGAGWTFAKNYQNLTLTVEFDVVTIAGRQTINLTFKSNVRLAVNKVWSENRTFYAGTAVKLLSENEYSVFLGSSSLTMEIDDVSVGNTWNVTDSFICDSGKNLKIEFFLNGVLIHTFTDFVVKPNVIANIIQEDKDVPTPDGTETIKVDKVFVSETDYAANAMYTLKMYKTGVEYGSSADTLYNSKDATSGEYINIEKISTGIYNQLKVSPKATGNNDPELAWDESNKKLKILTMTNLNDTIVRPVDLMYGDHLVVASEIQIVNFHKVKSMVDRMQALKPIGSSDFAVVDGFELKEVRAENLDFIVDQDLNTVTLESSIKQELKGVELTLIFEKQIAGGQVQVLNYKALVTIEPYAPQEKAALDVAFSGSTYDLLNGRYNAASLIADRNVKQLIVTGIKENEGEYITGEIIQGTFNPNGYIFEETGANCEITLKEISGSTRAVWVEFTITDRNDQTYTYLRELIIKNRQSITRQYPENLELGKSIFKVVEGFEEDGERLVGSGNIIGGAFELESSVDNVINYEPVIIYSNSSVVIDFSWDDVKKIHRMQAKNEIAHISDNTDFSIKVVAYENVNGMFEYSTRINTKYDTNKISLPFAGQGLAGMLVFKLETVSGNFEYFFLYICCVGTVENNVSVQNNLNVVAYKAGTAYPTNYSSTDVAKVDISSDQTYKTFVQTLSTQSALFDDITFSNFFAIGKKFSFNWANTSLYLYEGSYTGETEASPFNYNNKQWKKLDTGDVVANNDKIVIDYHFNKIIVGLVYQNDRNKYVYGTITIYTQPIQPVSIMAGLSYEPKYELPNGEFEATIAAGETSIASPFGIDWTAEIVSVDGVKFDATIHGSYFTSTSSIVSLHKRIGKDTALRVKYIKGGTIAFVNYTYLATILPTASGMETIGSFANETKGFVNSIDLLEDTVYKRINGKDKTYEQYFFGTYNGRYELAVNGVSIANGETKNGVTRIENKSAGSDKLTFAQDTTQSIIELKITYLDYEGALSRTFTFIVKNGMYILETVGSDNGLTSANRAKTTATNNYSDVVGSTLDVYFEKLTTDSGDVYKYTVKGLTIYTNKESELNLTFDVNNYVVKKESSEVLGVGEYIGVSSDIAKTVVGFVHSAQAMPVKATISIKKDDGTQYGTKDLYLEVVQTYTRLDAVYCVDGAEHENAKSYTIDASGNKIQNHIDDLRGVLMDKSSTPRRRFELLGTEWDETNEVFVQIPSDSVDLAQMGFKTEGNPNYIKFTVTGDAILSGGDKITFNIVTTNAWCNVYLNNNAGMIKDSVIYRYQIMAGSENDGLNFSTTSGIHKETENYVTFQTQDFDDKAKKYQSENFVIGTMKDENNSTIFKLEVEGVTFSTDQPRKIEVQTDESDEIGGYFHAIQYSFTRENYRYYITLDKDTSKVELIVIRPAGTEKYADKSEKLVITISGVNGSDGESYIVKDLAVVITNFDVKSKYSVTTDTSIYSGYRIHLINDGKIIGSDAAYMSYEFSHGSYDVGGKEIILTSSDFDNDLFTYNSSNKTIQTEPVGEDINVELAFNVKTTIDSVEYEIKTITYLFNINLNMQFVVNGADLKANIGNTSPETNFILTKEMDEDGDNQFDMTFPIISKEELNEDNGAVDEKYKEEGGYYNVLVFDLYKISAQNNPEAADDELLMSRQGSFVVELFSTSEVYSLKKEDGRYKLTFTQDYFGDVELKLSVKTDNGTYYVIWTVHVSAIKKLTYSSANHEFARMVKNSLPFSSDDRVKIINNSTTDNPAVILANPAKFADIDMNIDLTYLYKIHKYNPETNESTNEKLYTEPDADDENFVGASAIFTVTGGFKNSHTISLPSVPVTDEDEQQSYLVTYELTLKYLERTYKFYVSYVVINIQNVQSYTYAVTDPGTGLTTNHSSADIDVDTDLELDAGKYYLNLFYMVERYETGSNKYRISYQPDSSAACADEQFVLSVQNSTGAVVGRYFSKSVSGELLFDIIDSGESAEYKYDTASKILKKYNSTNSSWEAITGGVWTTNTMSPTSMKKPVFTSSFKNVVEFKTFIDKYLGKKSVVIGDDKQFTLCHYKGGNFVINLAENLTGSSVLFYNELVDSLNLVINGIKTVSILKYAEGNTNGFRLTTTYKITANKSVKMSTMFLQDYFEPTAEGIAAGITISTPVIGVGSSPSVDWVDGASGTPTASGDVYANINIPKDRASGFNTYQIKKATYTGSAAGAGSALYNVTKEFYYIDLNGHSELIVPDYSAVGIGETYFKVAYTPNQDNQFLELTSAFKVWKMDGDHKLTPNNSATIGGENSNIVTSATKSPQFTADKKSIYISSSHLKNYKREYPNKKNYPLTTAIITANGMSFLCAIEFALPDIVEYSCSYTSGSESNITINLAETGGEMYIPNSSGGYIKLSSDNLKKVESVYETSSGRFAEYNNSNGVITLNGTKMEDYFDANPSETYLYVEFELTTKDGDVLEFKVVVKKDV